MLSRRTDLTENELRAVLNYEPSTGVFTWKVRAGTRRAIGSEAGSITPSGYRNIFIQGRAFTAARLAVLYMKGEWPSGDVDHINGDRLDNRWLNLREASTRQNLANRPVMPSSQSGVKGVYWSPRHRKWGARIRREGRRDFLGYHDTIASAEAAYNQAAYLEHGAYHRRQSDKRTGAARATSPKTASQGGK